jgi:hypothetical protein
LCDDILLDVLAFLHLQAIVAADGLNTASWLLSTLITQHHPTAKKLFAKGPRVVIDNGATLEIDADLGRQWLPILADNGCFLIWNCNGTTPNKKMVYLEL